MKSLIFILIFLPLVARAQGVYGDSDSVKPNSGHTKFMQEYLHPKNEVYTLDSLLLWWTQYQECRQTPIDKDGHHVVLLPCDTSAVLHKLDRFMAHLREVLKNDPRQ